MSKPQVGIIMGSQSDLVVMKDAAEVLDELKITYELTIVSAHRTPLRMVNYATDARKRGLKVIIAGAGGAAHLPGMVAALTTLPVIGVPVKATHSLDGWDSVLSILQMPAGVPVATVALNGARNAGILAAQIIGTTNKPTATRLEAFKQSLKARVEAAAHEAEQKGWRRLL
jgi:5-(carboxyamino)imidazole ribonucleotide mutase